jgi:hypothetical protein
MTTSTSLELIKIKISENLLPIVLLPFNLFSKCGSSDDELQSGEGQQV